VKQLFFRLNQQQFRNHKYKHKNQPEIHAQDERGRSEQTAIDVDSIIIKTPSTEPPHERISTEDSLPDFEKFYEELPGYNGPVARNTDVYEVPISNPPSPPVSSIPVRITRVIHPRCHLQRLELTKIP